MAENVNVKANEAAAVQAQPVEYIMIDGVPFTAEQIKVVFGNKSQAPVPVQQPQQEVQESSGNPDFMNVATKVAKVVLVGGGVALLCAGGIALYNNSKSSSASYASADDYDDIEI